MANSHCKILQMDAQVLEVMRFTIIDLIMATDLKQHFAIMSRLQVCRNLPAKVLQNRSPLLSATGTHRLHILRPWAEDLLGLAHMDSGWDHCKLCFRRCFCFCVNEES